MVISAKKKTAGQGRRPVWLELALTRRVVGGGARQVASTDAGHLVGQWEDLDVFTVRDIGFYFLQDGKPLGL